MTDGQPFRIIGNAVRVARERRGLTLEGLAASADISHETLARMEDGAEEFSVNLLEKVAQALGVSLVNLIATAYYLAHDGESV